MARRKTNEEFVKEVFDLVGDEYVFLEKYDGSVANIKCKHIKCGHTWSVKPSNFTNNGTRCPICSHKQGYKKRTKTHEQFKGEFFDAVGDEYTLLSNYTNSRSKIKVRHNICGYEYEVNSNNWVRGGRCPRCQKKLADSKTRKTNEQFIQEVSNLVGTEYIFLEDYINKDTRIEVVHKECGYKYKVSPNNFLSNNTRCPECMNRHVANIKTKTPKQFEDEVYELVGDEYNFLGEYKHSGIKMTCKHNECGYEWDVLPSSFLQGTRCPVCSKTIQGLENRKTAEEYATEVYSLVGDEYSILKNYITSTQKVKLRHNKCGNEYYVEPHSFLKGTRCPKCAYEAVGIRFTKTNEEFLIDFNKRDTTNEYELLSKYQNSLIKIKVKHTKCGHIFEVIPNNFIRGGGCPKCNASKGEKRIQNVLDDLNIDYRQEYKVDGCEYKIALRFDFAIKSNGSTKLYLLEYDGQQHYRPVNFGGISNEKAKKKFKRNKARDNVKNQYCKDNNIPLLRIPYWEFDNIEQILEEWLEKYDLLHKNEEIA